MATGSVKGVVAVLVLHCTALAVADVRHNAAGVND